MNDIYELRQSLAEVVKEMKAGHMTQVAILTELRGLQPRVEKLEKEIEELKVARWKAAGIIALIGFIGFPATVFFLTHVPK